MCQFNLHSTCLSVLTGTRIIDARRTVLPDISYEQERRLCNSRLYSHSLAHTRKVPTTMHASRATPTHILFDCQWHDRAWHAAFTLAQHVHILCVRVSHFVCVCVFTLTYLYINAFHANLQLHVLGMCDALYLLLSHSHDHGLPYTPCTLMDFLYLF